MPVQQVPQNVVYQQQPPNQPVPQNIVYQQPPPNVYYPPAQPNQYVVQAIPQNQQVPPNGYIYQAQPINHPIPVATKVTFFNNVYNKYIKIDLLLKNVLFVDMLDQLLLILKLDLFCIFY